MRDRWKSICPSCFDAEAEPRSTSPQLSLARGAAEILAGISANFGQVVQPGSPCQSVITTPGGDWRLSAARIQIAALKAGELTKSIQVVNVNFPLAEG